MRDGKLKEKLFFHRRINHSSEWFLQATDRSRVRIIYSEQFTPEFSNAIAFNYKLAVWNEILQTSKTKHLQSAKIGMLWVR